MAHRWPSAHPGRFECCFLALCDPSRTSSAARSSGRLTASSKGALTCIWQLLRRPSCFLTMWPDWARSSTMPWARRSVMPMVAPISRRRTSGSRAIQTSIRAWLEGNPTRTYRHISPHIHAFDYLCLIDEVRTGLGGPFKAHPRRVDGLPMIIIPKYVQWTQGDDPPEAIEDEVHRYHGISDSELDAALDRRLRKVNELGQDSTSPDGPRVVHEVEQIQGELLRRARARHPSAQ
jgi:hypothetical protein